MTVSAFVGEEQTFAIIGIGNQFHITAQFPFTRCKYMNILYLAQRDINQMIGFILLDEPMSSDIELLQP